MIAVRVSIHAELNVTFHFSNRQSAFRIELWVTLEKAWSTQTRGSRSRWKSGKPNGAAVRARSPAPDPERTRAIESLRLARAELERQSDATTHPVRKQQIQAALAEIDKRSRPADNADRG